MLSSLDWARSGEVNASAKTAQTPNEKKWKLVERTQLRQRISFIDSGELELSERRVCTDAPKKVKNIFTFLQKKPPSMRSPDYKKQGRQDIVLPSKTLPPIRKGEPVRINYSRRDSNSAGSIVPVDPHRVMPVPMSRNPAPVSSSGPVARPVSVIRPVAHLDVDTDRIGGRSKSAHATQCRK